MGQLGGYSCVGISNQTSHEINGPELNSGYYPNPSTIMLALGGKSLSFSEPQFI